MDVRVDYKENWALKNWCLWTVVLEKTLESPLDCKDIQPVNPKRKSVLNIHWKVWCWSWNSNLLATWWKKPSHCKRSWCWERLKAKGEEGDRGWDGKWHHQLNGCESKQALADCDGQGSLVWCSPWGHKELDSTERLNWTESVQYSHLVHSHCCAATQFSSAQLLHVLCM